MLINEAIEVVTKKHSEAMVAISEEVSKAYIMITLTNEYISSKGLMEDYNKYLQEQLKLKQEAH